MSYQHQRIQEEVRRCFSVHRSGYHQDNIYRWIEADRIVRSMSGDMKPKKMQAMKTLTNAMYAMSDVERIEGTLYWRSKQTGKLHETKQTLTRGIKWLQLQRVLIIKYCQIWREKCASSIWLAKSKPFFTGLSKYLK